MKAVLTAAAVLALLGVVGFVADRMLLALEARGWIYYRRKRGHVDRMGQSALHIQSLFEPGKRHEVVEREKVRREDGAPGAPPE